MAGRRGNNTSRAVDLLDVAAKCHAVLRCINLVLPHFHLFVGLAQEVEGQQFELRVEPARV